MEIEIKRITSWERVLNACRMTVNKKYVEKEPSEEFKKAIIRSEHSPLRMLEFDITVHDIPYWVHTELCRHNIGVEKFVTTSRPDRTGEKVNRNELPQGRLVSMTFAINAQALINISKVRLCSLATKEARMVWSSIIAKLREIEPALAEACVPFCVYRSRCPEISSCNYDKTEQFKQEYNRYWNGKQKNA